MVLLSYLGLLPYVLCVTIPDPQGPMFILCNLPLANNLCYFLVQFGVIKAILTVMYDIDRLYRPTSLKISCHTTD